MKKAVLFLLLLITKNCIGQQIKGSSAFTKFVESPNIDWASYNLIYGQFNDSNFNIYITNRYKKNEIKCSLPFYNIHTVFSNEQIPIPYDSLEKIALYPSCILPIYDSSGNAAIIDRESYRIRVDTTNYKTINLEEILYVENGKLFSYIPFGTICTPIYSGEKKEYLGEVEYFSTFFNFLHTNNNQTFNPKLLIKVENKIRIDSVDVGNKLKELYGRNLLETLWPYINSGKIKLESVKNNSKVDVADNVYKLLKDYTVDEYPVPIEYITLAPNLFSEIELIQDFFYNEKENTLSNRIKEVYLCTKRKIRTQNSSDRILKLVF